MSALQIGLAVTGGLVLAGLVAHGAWTTRRNQPRLAEPMPRSEPGLGTEPVLDPLPQEPAGDDAAGDPGLDLRLLGVPDRRVALDPLIDVMATLELDQPVVGEAILAHLPSTRRVGSKPFAIEARTDDAAAWEAPVAGHRYVTVQAGVQMANRAGPLNEIEYSEFVVKTQSLADALGGTPEFPDMRDAVARARELDAFAGANDAQLGVTLRASQTAWSAGYVQQNAARLGFVSGVLPGRMVLPSSTPGNPPIVSLHYDAQAALADDPALTAMRELTLDLDVAQVPRSERPYVRLREAARTLAQAMDGHITDDNGQPLSDDAMDQIGSELETLYDQLDARELSAGSVLARRLFS